MDFVSAIGGLIYRAFHVCIAYLMALRSGVGAAQFMDLIVNS
jgi:hypothetical protein